jgi:hypothetical protein
VEVADLGAHVFDDADELVADRPGLKRRVAAVVPEVGPADAGDETRTIASMGSTIDGSRRSPTVTERGSLKMAARMTTS